MRAHQMDQETAERLLGGPVADAQDGPEVLVRLLAAVRAAPRPHELNGEAAALQAFRLAHADPVPVPAHAGSGPVLARAGRRSLAGLLGVKIALAGLLAAATGGVALAAVTGTLPGPLGHEPAGTPSADASSRPAPSGAPGPAATRGVLPDDRPEEAAGLTGLCTAYRTEPGENRHQVLATPRFADLIAAAGGRERVGEYCERLLHGQGKQNGPTAEPTKRPGAEPTGRATGRPTRTPATPAPTRPSGPTVNQPDTVGKTQR
ncbi:hypothetical protein [Micromonospora auratinigra]|uniref:Uncharacterized protein n=1 Tax=Micromonospora auratinigra TaxID=261654 RepID=A0A1A8Z156_9ACTN|nr:hypothetical protein [Micromonospora auratinigra]SBT37468.1 hypothetical protein GA0070611_0219 [Micromonospora auratinigra]